MDFARWLQNLPKWIRARKWNLGLAAFLLALVVFGAYQVDWNPDQGPCSRGKYAIRCFQVEKDVCEIAYRDFTSRCNDMVSRIQLPPARLTDPIVRNCVDLRYGRTFPFLRTADPECVARQKDLEAWAQRNPDFSSQ